MSYSIISVAGADRTSFLQGQLTQDVAAVTEQTGLNAAWCNPKGRVVTTVRVFSSPSQHFLAVPRDVVDAVYKRLEMYRLRADVAFDVTDTHRLVAIPTERALSRVAGVATLALPFVTDFVEVFGTDAALAAAEIDAAASIAPKRWSSLRVMAGLCDIGAAQSEKYTPHMLNLDCTGTLSFTKGCYTGQEVVARTENLGRSKRRLNRYRAREATVQIGDPVTSDGIDLGRVVNATETDVLAVVPIDRHAEIVSVGDVELIPEPLPYAYLDTVS